MKIKSRIVKQITITLNEDDVANLRTEYTRLQRMDRDEYPAINVVIGSLTEGMGIRES